MHKIDFLTPLYICLRQPRQILAMTRASLGPEGVPGASEGPGSEGHQAKWTMWPLFHIDAQKGHFSRFEPSLFTLYRTLIALKLRKTIFPDDFDPSTHFQSSTSE